MQEKRLKTKKNLNLLHNIYICNSYHHLLISIIKTLKSNVKSDIVICGTISNGEKLIDKLIKTKWFNKVYFWDEILPPSKKKIVKTIIHQHIISPNDIEKNLNINLKKYDNIFLFYDDFGLGYYLNKNKIKYHLIEDAKDAYTIVNRISHKYRYNYKKTIVGRMIYLFNYGFLGTGQYPYCIDIEVNSAENLKILTDKIIVKPKDELYTSLTEFEKKQIFEFFANSNEYTNIESNCILLLTQALDKDGYIKTSTQQIKIYKDIVDKFCNQSNVIIKPHPRDNTDYSCISNVKILSRFFPVEVLSFNKSIKFTKAITITSTSINSLDFIPEKIMLGLDYLEEYLK